VEVGYLGPEGTFTQEAALAGVGSVELSMVPLPTVFDVVMAVHNGDLERAVVPIENSLEGSVSATLDALAMETEAVVIVAESVHPIRQCLIAREALELDAIEVVISHPQANGQCSRFIRSRLPGARVMTTSSTADAVRMVSEQDGRWAALGTRLAAELYGCQVLRAGVEDLADNETRFVWLARLGRDGSRPRPGLPGVNGSLGPWKTAIVFWGIGSDAPGWLVNCLSEFASRGVNLTRIESRPRKQGLGRYMFFADLEGRDDEGHVREGLNGLRAHVETLRVLGSFPAAV
jgi:prephenate dehydratase